MRRFPGFFMMKCVSWNLRQQRGIAMSELPVRIVCSSCGEKALIILIRPKYRPSCFCGHCGLLDDVPNAVVNSQKQRLRMMHVQLDVMRAKSWRIRAGPPRGPAHSYVMKILQFIGRVGGLSRYGTRRTIHGGAFAASGWSSVSSCGSWFSFCRQYDMAKSEANSRDQDRWMNLSTSPHLWQRRMVVNVSVTTTSGRVGLTMGIVLPFARWDWHQADHLNHLRSRFMLSMKLWWMYRYGQRIYLMRKVGFFWGLAECAAWG